MYYEDDEIIIRDIKNEDLISLFSWSIDREINKYDPRPLPHTSEELLKDCISYCRRFDCEVMNENIEERKYKYFIITDKSDNPIGFVNVFSIDRIKRQCEMGIVIGDKRYWGKGAARCGIETAVEYIFKNMDIKRIYIETGEANIRAKSLFKKQGFIKCGEYTEDEGFIFVVMEKHKEGLK